MTLHERLSEYVRACFTGIWIESHEHQDALTAITQLCRQEAWQLATWNIEQGLKVPGSTSSATSDAGSPDPLAAIRAVNSLATPEGTSILVLQNFHRFMQSAEIVQALAQQIVAGKQNRTFVVVLSPLVQIPVELEKLFVVVEHELPGREQLAEIARGIATEDGELPTGQEQDLVLDAAVGLTRYEAEAAFSLSLVREGRITADTLWEQKSQMLKKSGLLSLYRGGEDFSRLGGLSALKSFTKRALLQPSRGNPLKRPRGVLLLSPPGCGKSQFCKSLGKEVGRPVLVLDVGNLLGSLVGQSEERTRQALRIIDAMAPCVAMIDEVEKAFAGVNGSGDSGVSSRMFGTFLSWLNDHDSDVFVVCTANDVSRLPPEFGRSERFDGIFFLDLPGRPEKDAIWQIYREQFEIAQNQRQPDDTNWTGAEIRACCRLAALLDVPLSQAAQNVVPVAVTAAESVDKLRTWASGRCLSAEQPGLYQRSETGNTRRRFLHMKLGIIGTALATVIVITGLHIGIEAARVSPPDLRVFGLAPKEFMAVPVLSILVFGLFVLMGVLNRRRPEVHRPMMLMASVSVIGAALGRITLLKELYAGTWWETVFTAFLMQVIVATVLLVAKCVVSKSFDRWLASGVAAFTVACVMISLGARTQVWDQFATFLLR